jgi:hypothetical protein
VPGYRGRLIWPFVARIARLDLEGTAADPDGAGALESGFDDVYREPVQVPDGTQTGTDARLELEAIDLRCQVEDQAWETLRMLRTGNATRLEVVLVFHFSQLEELGLVDATTGDALAPRVGDRLVAIHRYPGGELVQAVPTPPGLFCEEAQPRSYGLSGGARNLLVCTFRERTRGVPGS